MNLLIKLLYSGMFGCFLVNHITNFTIRYLRFASIRLINDNNLHYFYFFMIAFEAVSVVVPFLKLPRSLLRVYDGLLILYCLTVPTALFCIYELTNGCPECHFISASFISNQYFNSGLVLVLGLVYIFKLRDLMQRSQVKIQPA